MDALHEYARAETRMWQKLSIALWLSVVAAILARMPALVDVQSHAVIQSICVVCDLT